MAAKPNPKILNQFEERALNADILVRFEIQHTMSENSKPVLEAEFGVWQSIIQQITRGEYDCSRTKAVVSPEVCREIKRRQDIWALANERMQDYTMKALAKKYGVSAGTVNNRIAEVRRQARIDSKEWGKAA